MAKLIELSGMHLTKKQLHYLLLAVAAIISIATSTQKKSVSTIVPIHAPTIPATVTVPNELYKVIKVVDGDTIDIDVHGVKETVRFIGIDTPEVVDPRKPVQCFGKEASNKAKELLNGKNVLLEIDPTQGDRDKYKRLLRFVFLEDGTNVNKFMIAEGYAHEYTYQSHPYKYQEDFIHAQQTAREQKKGLWADGVCILPTPLESVVQ